MWKPVPVNHSRGIKRFLLLLIFTSSDNESRWNNVSWKLLWVTCVPFMFHGYFIHHDNASSFASLFKTEASSRVVKCRQNLMMVKNLTSLWWGISRRSIPPLLISAKGKASIQCECPIRYTDACSNWRQCIGKMWLLCRRHLHRFYSEGLGGCNIAGIICTGMIHIHSTSV